MNICFLRQMALDMMRRDIPANLDYYYRSEPWLDEYFSKKGNNDYWFDSGIEIKEFKLIPGEADTDVKNTIALYESLRGKINRLQATDYRLWSFLAHTCCWDYMKTRWELDESIKNKESRINDRYFIAARSPNVRNGISRLFWMAELTYDENNSNPYEYLEYVLRWQDLAVGALDRQIGRAKNSLLGNLQALKEADLNEDDRRLFFTKINQCGGVKLLDALSREQSLEISRRYIDQIKALPVVENGKSILIRNIENGTNWRCDVEKGKLFTGNEQIKTTDRLLRRRKGSLIDVNKDKWQIVEIC